MHNFQSEFRCAFGMLQKETHYPGCSHSDKLHGEKQREEVGGCEEAGGGEKAGGCEENEERRRMR